MAASPESDPRDVRALLLKEVLERRTLRTVFQPIFSFETRSVLGYEALVRGPQDSLLQSPVELFSAAQDHDSLLQLSIICIQTVLRAFAALRLPGTVFINVSPRVVALPGFSQDRARSFLTTIGLDPSRVVIELTEHDRPADFGYIQSALLLYRSIGLKVAIDDLGEGFSSLRLWSELKPEYVKADKHFVRGAAQDPVKFEFLKAMQGIADACGSRIIAEGIEEAAEFKLVAELGIACGQGYFIGAPMERPAAILPDTVAAALADTRKITFPQHRLREVHQVTARDFLRDVPTVPHHSPLSEARRLLDSTAAWQALPVVEGTTPIGLIGRRHLSARLSRDEGQEATCRDVMNIAPLYAESSLPLSQLCTLLADATPQHLADGFIITEGGRCLGMGAVNDVIRLLNDKQLNAARYTNPLTLLPGQVPTNEHMERLLKAHQPFAAALVELTPLKGFNDAYGFRRGDELIRATGRMLESALDPSVDLVGHVYANRFVLLMQSVDWRARLESLVQRFPALLNPMLDSADAKRGHFVWTSRQGDSENRPWPRIAVGALQIVSSEHETRHDVMAGMRAAAERAGTHPTSALHVAD